MTQTGLLTNISTRTARLEEALAQGLTSEEFDRIKGILGRTPNITETAIYAVMWSEHCSYKNSILELKTLPRSGARLLASAGEENAGLVDIGDGWAVAFKIESHNHPSAVEPFQGAATGVGGILRDIFTMGARPLLILNSLRFGDLNESRNRFLFDGVVRGIAHYGNCFGVPTAGGEVMFDSSYTGNPLVNAMAVGVVRTDRITRNKPSGVGNPVFYVGSRTGRDGIHGATFASEELSEDNESKRPSVQVGDPFAEKLLLEATLELARTDALVAIQDMGAAGLTCSSSEMSAAGGMGIDIDLDKVPMRETDMNSWEIMLSESQERMLLVAEKGKEQVVRDIFSKWDLQAVEIGCLTADGLMRVRQDGDLVAEIPAHTLVLGGGAPQYRRESALPPDLTELLGFDPGSLPPLHDSGSALLKLLAYPDIASKEWIYSQYDQSVRTNTAVEAGKGDAAVVRVEGTTKGIAAAVDGNGRYVRLNPRVGAELAVAESARNVACVGARPMAVTNCLNFGHPYKPSIYYFFREAIAGMGRACRELDTPVTGGNVSFYNETNGEPVFPTPVIGMLGVMKDVSKFVTANFKKTGDEIYLLGSAFGHGLGGSAYLKLFHDRVAGAPQPVDWHAERALIELLLEAADRKLLRSAHDISDGGLAVSVAECCIMIRENLLGADLDFPAIGSKSSHFFGESPGRAVISISPASRDDLLFLAHKFGVPLRRLGTVGGSRLLWRGEFDLPVETLAEAFYQAIPKLMKGV
jgi:phosphoribosylformylglycinamidine synthase